MHAILSHPYAQLMRLHQPTGIWLLLWPCWWALVLASHGALPLNLLGLVALGAVVMRGAGCIINDLWDRDIDAQVERTRGRPLASGVVTPLQAMLLLGLLLAIACGIALMLGATVVWWSMASLPLVVLYPLMKRITWWPQLFLGITFNWGVWLGWVAVSDGINWAAGTLYVGSVFWTLGYDTIYAHQDKRDDARIGVKSTALRFGIHTKRWLWLFYSLAVLCFFFSGVLEGGSWPYGVGVFSIAAHFIWQIQSVDLNDPASCRRVFCSNSLAGALLFIGAVAM